MKKSLPQLQSIDETISKNIFGGSAVSPVEAPESPGICTRGGEYLRIWDKYLG